VQQCQRSLVHLSNTISGSLVNFNESSWVIFPCFIQNHIFQWNQRSWSISYSYLSLRSPMSRDATFPFLSPMSSNATFPWSWSIHLCRLALANVGRKLNWNYQSTAKRAIELDKSLWCFLQNSQWLRGWGRKKFVILFWFFIFHLEFSSGCITSCRSFVGKLKS